MVYLLYFQGNKGKHLGQVWKPRAAGRYKMQRAEQLFCPLPYPESGGGIPGITF